MKAIACHGLLAQVLIAEEMAIDSSVNSTQDVSVAVQTSDTLNRSWKNDKSKFGFKMLQKMGWTEGKGLGKNEDGMAEHVKVAKKSNNLGLGAKSDSTGAESWASTAISFNGVLEALGKAYGSAATRQSSQKDSSTRSSATSKKRRKDKKCNKDKTFSANTESKSGSSSCSESVSAAQASSHCPSRAKRIRSKDVKAFSSADLRAILGQAAPANDSPSATVTGTNFDEEDARVTKSSKKKKAKPRGKDRSGGNRCDNNADDDDAFPRSMDLVETEAPTSTTKRRRIEGMELGGNGRQEVGSREQSGGAREDHMSTESLSLESDRNKKDKKKSRKRIKKAQELGRAGAVAGKVERDEGTTVVVAGREKKRRKKSASDV